MEGFFGKMQCPCSLSCLFFILSLGFPICKDFFLIVYGIGKKRLENLQKHYKKNGILPRVHGNKGRLAIRVCSLETLKRVVSFLDNYAEEHAVTFPGRVPGFKCTDVRLLPSSNTKASIHRVYEQAAASAGVTAVSYPKFVEMWNKLRPQMRITKPMTDLCHTCQKNNTSIYRSANLPDDEKNEVVHKQEKHLPCEIPKYVRIFVLATTVVCVKEHFCFTQAMVCKKIVKIAYGRICTLSHIASLVNKKINKCKCQKFPLSVEL